MKKPKIEITCKGDGGVNKAFQIKNVSTLIVSNIHLQAFDLVFLDGSRQDLLATSPNGLLPTSLGSNEGREFLFPHPRLERREVGYKALELLFSLEDEELNVYHCKATKNAEDNSNFMLGQWDTIVELVNNKDIDEGKMKAVNVDTINNKKIFISHRGMEAEAAEAMVDFLENLKVPSEAIVCTSVPDHLIPNGGKIYDWLRSQFTDFQLHVIFMLSKNYYESPDCLNEMGAAWVMKKRSDVILLPGFTPGDIQGCIGKDTMAMEWDGRQDILENRIKQLKDDICAEYNLPSPEERRWNKIRSELIDRIKKAKPKELKKEDD